MAGPQQLPLTQTHIVHSDLMDFDFEITTQGPPIDWPEPLPVVYQTDANFGIGFAADMATMLLMGGEIPPVLTVGIGYPVGGDIVYVTGRRMYDFSPTSDEWQLGQLNASPLVEGEVVGGGAEDVLSPAFDPGATAIFEQARTAEHTERLGELLAGRDYPNLRLKTMIWPEETHFTVPYALIAHGLRWVFNAG